MTFTNMNGQNADENEKMMQSIDLEIVPTTGEFYNDYQNVADALGILHHPALANDDDSTGFKNLFRC